MAGLFDRTGINQSTSVPQEPTDVQTTTDQGSLFGGQSVNPVSTQLDIPQSATTPGGPLFSGRQTRVTGAPDAEITSASVESGYLFGGQEFQEIVEDETFTAIARGGLRWQPQLDYFIGDIVSFEGRVYLLTMANQPAGSANPSANTNWIDEGVASTSIVAELSPTGTPTSFQEYLFDTNTGFEIVADADDATIGRIRIPTPVTPFRLSVSLDQPARVPITAAALTQVIATGSASSGTLTTITGGSGPTGSAVSVSSPRATFTGTFNALGTYTFTLTGDGEDSEGTAVTGQMASASFERFIPYFFGVSSTQPTALSDLTVSNDTATVGDQHTLTGTAQGDAVYFATEGSAGSPVFMIGDFEFVPNNVGQLTAPGADGTTYAFNLWNVGPINANTRNVRIVMI